MTDDKNFDKIVFLSVSQAMGDLEKIIIDFYGSKRTMKVSDVLRIVRHFRDGCQERADSL